MRAKPEPKKEEHIIIWPRADPIALTKFYPSTKRCTMNCGQHKDDPRTYKECKFLCEDCEVIEKAP